MASNKNTGDVVGAVKKIRTAAGTLTQTVQGGYKTRPKTSAQSHEVKKGS